MTARPHTPMHLLTPPHSSMHRHLATFMLDERYKSPSLCRSVVCVCSMYDMLCVYTVCMYVCCVYAVCMTCCVYIQYVMYVVCMCMFYVYECMNLASKVISGYLVSRYIWGSLGPSV